MGRYVTAPRGTTVLDGASGLAVRALTANGTIVDTGNKNPDWFGGNYPYNVTSTPADAAKLAAILAQKLATYLIDYSVIAKNIHRMVLPASKTVLANGSGAAVNVPTATSTFTSIPIIPYASPVDYASQPWGGGNGQAQFGSFSAGSTFTVNPHFLLQSDALIDFLARDMAIGYLDNIIGSLYAGFTTNAPVGTANTTLVAAVLTAAIAALTGQAAYQAGTPVFFFLTEQNCKDLDTVALEPYAGYVVSDFIGRRRIESGGVLAEIFSSEKVTVTASTNRHGIAFCPTAFNLLSASVVSSSTDPTTTTPLTTSAMVSSTPVNNFVASVKYGLAAASGNNFAFNVLPNCAAGVVDNALGVRVES